MTKQEFMLMRSTLFSPIKIEADRYVIERQMPRVAEHYHKCLKRCPRPLAFAKNELGLSVETINRNKIGFCDRSLPAQFPHHKTVEGIKLRGTFERLGLLAGTGHELMRGCLTLPLHDGDEQVGMFGLRYDRPRRGVAPLKYSTFGHLPVYAPCLDGKVAIMCETPFTVLALSEKGYKNGFSVLGTDVTGFTLTELKRQGIESVVYFTSATSDDEYHEDMRFLMFEHGITPCDLPLPFIVERLGKWDDAQWKIFDKRLNRVLSEQGLRNERFQA